jgi:hypothetical protein
VTVIAEDDDPDVWLLWYEDPDHGPEIFSGSGATARATARYDQQRQAWSCHLFLRLPARRAVKPAPDATDIPEADAEWFRRARIVYPSPAPLGRDRPMRMGDMGGTDNTYASMLIWDEAAFAYRRITRLARGTDARAEFLALHDGLTVIVLNARYGNHPPVRPGEPVV